MEFKDGTYVYRWSVVDQIWIPVAICTNFTYAAMLMKYAVDHDHLIMAWSDRILNDEERKRYVILDDNRWLKG